MHNFAAFTMCMASEEETYGKEEIVQVSNPRYRSPCERLQNVLLSKRVLFGGMPTRYGFACHYLGGTSSNVLEGLG